MRCEYCDVEVTTYPDNGICIHCGAKLPPKPAVPAVPPAPAAQTAYVPVQPTAAPETPHVYPQSRCPHCGSTHLEMGNRGFSWGWALLGFFLFPFWGLLFGFIGMKKPRFHCRSCNRKWKPV